MCRPMVKSASRALEVLELFNQERRPLRLPEIYELLYYAQSSATNLMKSLLQMGYVNYNRAPRTYVPTKLINGLGNWLSSALYAQARYHRLVDTLQKRTDETVRETITEFDEELQDDYHPFCTEGDKGDQWQMQHA